MDPDTKGDFFFSLSYLNHKQAQLPRGLGTCLSFREAYRMRNPHSIPDRPTVPATPLTFSLMTVTVASATLMFTDGHASLLEEVIRLSMALFRVSIPVDGRDHWKRP